MGEIVGAGVASGAAVREVWRWLKRVVRVARGIGLTVAIGIAGQAAAQIPHTLNYQGYLTNSGGTPVNATVSMTFSFWNASSVGVQLGANDSQPTVAVTNGVFNVAINATGVAFDIPVWLQVIVNGETLTPRQAVNAAGYALRAAGVDTTAALPAAQITGTIGTAQIADGAVTTAKLATAQQLPTCTDGQGIRHVGSGWQCYTVAPIVTRVAAVPGMANQSGWTRMGIPADGKPVIGFGHPAGGMIRTAKCNNASCSGGVSVGPNVGAPAAWDYTGMTLGTDGFAMFGIPWGTQLDVQKCADAVCTTNALNSISVTTLWVSMARGSDGFPVLAYRGVGQGTQFTKCNDANCAARTSNLIDANPPDGTAVAIGNDTFPVVATFSHTDQSLRVIKCANVSCTSVTANTTLDASAVNGPYVAIAVPADGNPVIAFHDTTNWRLRFAKCGNAACSSGNVVSTVDGTGTGVTLSMAIASDGLPIVSYYDSQKQILKLLKCGNAACNSGNAISVLQSAGDVGYASSIAIGADGYPVIAYYNTTAGYIEVLKCTNPSCTLP